MTWDTSPFPPYTAAVPAAVAEKMPPRATATSEENRVNGFDVFALPRIGVDVPFSPDCTVAFPLYLRQTASAKPYAYVSGNPLNMTDPSGLFDLNPLDALPKGLCVRNPLGGDNNNGNCHTQLSTKQGAAAVAATVAVGAIIVTAGAAAPVEAAVGGDVSGEVAADEAAAVAVTPPGYDAGSWDIGAASRDIGENHYWDPEGGEWRLHSPDPWHDEAHWDYNPWEDWNSPWQHIDAAAALTGFAGSGVCDG